MNDWERTFIQEYWVVTYLENYSADSGRHSHPVKGALLETMLPSLHYLVIVATLDEALAEYVEINNVPWPNKTKRDLLNRIKVVSGVVSGIDAVVLQGIRERRNVIAHEPDSILSRPVTWEELDGAIGCVCLAMKELGLIGDTPQIVAFCERTPELFLNELGSSGERMRHKFIVGAKLNDEVCMEFSREISYLPPGHP